MLRHSTNRSRMLWAALLLFPVLAVACGAVSQPQGWAPPVVTGDAIYVTDASGHIYALDLETRAVRWRYPVEGERDKGIELKAIYGRPVVAGDTLYVGAYDGFLYAINTKTGEQRWRYDTGSPIVGGALADGQNVYVGSGDGWVYALDDSAGGTTPVLRWKQPTEGSIWSQPVEVNGVVYVTSMDGKMYALDAATGQTRWAQPFAASGGIPTTPLVSDGDLLVGALDKRLYAVDSASGAVKWSFEADNWFWSEPLAHEGLIYAAALDGKLYAFDPRLSGTDRALWTFQADAPIRSRAAVVGDILVVADRNGVLYGLGLVTGGQRWRTELKQPVLADLSSTEAAVFVSLQNGALKVVNPVTGEAQDVPYKQ